MIDFKKKLSGKKYKSQLIRSRSTTLVTEPTTIDYFNIAPRPLQESRTGTRNDSIYSHMDIIFRYLFSIVSK